jgi:hypothetical protein
MHLVLKNKTTFHAFGFFCKRTTQRISSVARVAKIIQKESSQKYPKISERFMSPV